jgi:hypothetical protein
MLSDQEIKLALYESWRTEPLRPPKVQLHITDEKIFSIDQHMTLQATRRIDMSPKVYRQPIRHELRHLTVSPVYWSTWADWAVFLAKQGYRDWQIPRILNVFTDFLVDFSLFKEYPEDFEACFQALLKQYWKEPRSPALILYLRGHEKFMDTSYVPEQTAEMEKDAEDLKFWCLEAAEPQYTVERRLKEAADIISRYLKEEDNFDDGGQGKGQGQPSSSREAHERIAEKAASRGLTPSQAREAMNAVAGKGTGSHRVNSQEAQDILDYARALKIYRQAVKIVAHVKGRAGLKVDVPDVWKIGDAPEQLDMTGTVNRFGGVTIPGVTTMKNAEFTVNKSVWKDAGAKLAIALDESSSMTLPEWNIACQAAVGLVAWAMEKRCPVYLQKFDSPDFPDEPGYMEFRSDFSFAYWDAMKWLVRRQLGGGTEIQQVFEALEKVRNIQQATIVILTDCGISYLQRARKAIASLAAKKCAFRVFMIGENKVPSDFKAAFAGQDVKFYAVSRLEKLTEEAVRAVDE